MIEKVKSEFTGKEYCPTRCVRLINTSQVAFFWSRGALPVDIYASVDFNTEKPILVYIFEKDATRELYEEWKNRKNEEE